MLLKQLLEEKREEILKEAGVERQEAGGRLEGDSDPPLNEDRQIKDFGGGLKPSWARQQGFTLTKNPPSCLLPPAFCLARRAVKD